MLQLDMAIWTHVPNFTVLFSVSPTWLCITLSNRQVHVAQEMLGEAFVRKCLCVRGLNDRPHTCHRLLGPCSVPGWGCKRSPGVQSYPQHLPVQSSSGIIFDFLPSDPLNCAFLLMLGVLGQEIQSGEKKPQPQETSLFCPSNCCYFLMRIYIPTSQLHLKCFWSLEVVR